MNALKEGGGRTHHRAFKASQEEVNLLPVLRQTLRSAMHPRIAFARGCRPVPSGNFYERHRRGR
jgi:hypothetical protein